MIKTADSTTESKRGSDGGAHGIFTWSCNAMPQGIQAVIPVYSDNAPMTSKHEKNKEPSSTSIKK